MRRSIAISILLVAVLAGTVSAVPLGDPDETKPELGAQVNNDDLATLRDAAAGEASQEEKAEEETGKTVFESGSLGLQKLNPELSVTGEMLGIFRSGIDELPGYDTVFREMGLHLEAYLDPYSKFKAAIPISEEGAELGEVYFTRFGFLGTVNLTLGKFRQQFGVVNRWHKHALDTFDFPLALRRIFGNDGLNQTGLSLDASTATGSLIHGLTVQITDGDNPVLFGGNAKNRPSILGHYKLYQDLSPSTYLEIGGTGLLGWNDSWTTLVDSLPAEEHERLNSSVYGIDLSLLWEPTRNMRYRNFQWRSEAYFMDKEILAPDGSGRDHIRPWGFYSLVQAKVSRKMELGVRFDYFEPEVRDDADLGVNLIPTAQVVSTEGAHRQAFGGWLTWWQSPFVKFRLGYSYENGEGTGPALQTTALQIVFAAGPHKHERY